jgi:ribonucleotide reductase beta subunit family protein with ferritin-like domain
MEDILQTEILADTLMKDKDRYNPNTICGCLNRIKRIKNQKTLSEKYNLDPEADKTAWVFWKLQEASFWPADEFDYSRLQSDYENSSPGTRRAVDLMNGFFSGADGIIVENTGFRFAVEAETMSETGALLTQMKQEFIHAETYIKTIQTMIRDPIHRQEVLKIADTLPCIRDKELLMEKYMEADIDKAYRIIAFAASEGIMFWSSFAFVFWLRSIGIFVTLAEINEKISIDESMHRDYACARYRELPTRLKPPVEHVIKVISEFINVELKFSDAMTSELEKEGQDYTSEVARKFVHFMGNSLLLGLGYDAHWEDAEFPEYMRSISSCQKSNFYEVNEASYTQFSVDKIYNKFNNDQDNKITNDNDDDDVDNCDF